MRGPRGKAAVFLDRDNTLIEDVPNCARPADVRLLNGAADAVRTLNSLGFLTIVITNQSAIGRGILTLKQLDEVHVELRNQLAASKARIDAIYFCPHLPTDGCACRKPGTRLFERACEELEVNPRQSFVVGDRGADIEAGLRMGCRTVLIQGKLGLSDLALSGINPTVSCVGLKEFVQWLVTHMPDWRMNANGGSAGSEAHRVSASSEVDRDG